MDERKQKGKRNVCQLLLSPLKNLEKVQEIKKGKEARENYTYG